VLPGNYLFFCAAFFVSCRTFPADAGEATMIALIFFGFLKMALDEKTIHHVILIILK